MKRTIVAILLVAALLAPAFGQFAPSSLQNGLTAGTFVNEIDQAFQANADFGSYNSSFIFSGLGNPTSGTPFYSEADAFDTSFVSPLRIGYYVAGSFPLSLYSSIAMTPLSLRTIASAYTVPTYSANVPVTVGTTTTNYKYITDSISHTPTDTIYLRYNNIDLQALAKLGPATVGLYLNYIADNNTADTALANDYFDNVVSTYYYNSAAAGAAPIAAIDYGTTTSKMNVNAIPAANDDGACSFKDTVRFAIPVAMKTGAIEHRAYIDTTFGVTDKSATYAASQTFHTSTVVPGSANDQTLSLTSKSNTVDVALNYNLYLPANKADDKWIAGIKFDLGINSQKYAFDDLIRPYAYTVASSKTALAGGTHEVYTKDFKSGLDLGGTLSGARIFTYKPASAITFKLIPSLGFTVSRITNPDVLGVGGAYLSGATYSNQPLNAVGAYDATTYTLSTTTVTGTPGSKLTLNGMISVPMGLTVKPDSWKFGIMMGATPSLTLTSVNSTTSNFTSTTTSQTYTGDTVSGTVVNVNTEAPAKSTSTFTPTLSENHYIGITVPFDGGVRFDARLNGNLLAFESFTIQALIPLK